MSATCVGTVATVWRYPVKSMLGEELNASQVTTRGLLGDRAHALVDHETGKVVSAKNPNKWPELFAYRVDNVDSWLGFFFALISNQSRGGVISFVAVLFCR